jgi:hypothetical protein
MAIINYRIEYFHPRVKAEIENWPDGILADFARVLELLMEFGPNLRMPHSRAMGGGLFELSKWARRHRPGVLLFHRRAACGDTSRLPKENRGYPEEGIENCPEKDEGGAEWLT